MVVRASGETVEVKAMVFDPEAMDAAADDAAEELDTLDPEVVKAIASWWARWYLKAGHKRLGRLMVKRV